MPDKPPPSPDQDGSIWGDLARMEAEVVDPEEEKTAHYDYNAVREKLKALDPEALAAAEAMFEEDDDPATVMAPQEPATVMAQPSPLASRGPSRAPVVRNAIPGVRRLSSEPRIPAPPESHPGTESLLDDDDDFATAIVADDDVERMRAAMNARIEQAIGPAPGAADDDFDEEEPTRVADPAQAEAAMRMIAEREAELRARAAGGPASRPSAPRAMPSSPGHLGHGLGAPPLGPAAGAPTPPTGPASPIGPLPGGAPAPRPPTASLEDPEGQDLVQLLDQQRKRDTLMYVLAALLFAIGIGVWLMNQ